MQKNSAAKRINPRKKGPSGPTISELEIEKVQAGRHHCFICRKKRIDKKLSIVFSHGFIGNHAIRACTATCIAKCVLRVLEANNSGSILTIRVNER